ncbi:MAG: TonB-dependent receptor [Bacteroidaceae bacterium]|nr:TonB-dependent receptor [Bacteroidaceae bacterium]
MKQRMMAMLLVIQLFSLSASAQTGERGGRINLWGYVVDSFLQTGLEGAKVTLMTADSTVVDTIRTYHYDGNALFHFSLPAKTQNIILRAEHEGYESASISMKVRHYSRVKDVYAPWINLKKKSSMQNQSLNEVVVTASKVQLVCRGDTLVYNADAFNMPQGSMLDGLIRQLPGVTLKENGEIKVNGRKVDYLTLNGTDFFKGNNKMMLDNLPYYTVKNIKVYDRSTDVSKFLGDDDARKDYVMDVVLKREYSIGLTANAEVDGGTKERWMARVFGLRFSDHSRLTLFGNGNNINETGRPGEAGEWKASDPTDGIKRHNEVNANLFSEDHYKRWKNELAMAYTYDKNDRQSQQESETYLQGGGEFAYRADSELTHDKKFNVTNTFTRNKSTSPIYLTSLLGYNYGNNNLQQLDSARVSSSDVAVLYRLNDFSKRQNYNHHLFTANHVLLKLPWGDRLNLRLNALYGTQRAKSFSNYLLKYDNNVLPEDLRRRYEPRSFDQYDWQAEAEYVIRFPHDWNLDIGYKFRQCYDTDDAPSYRLDRDAAWLQQAPSIDALPSVLSNQLLDSENSLDIVTHTKQHLLSARFYYTRNTAESYINFEMKLPLAHERKRQHYQRGEVDARVQRKATFLDANISFTRQFHQRNIYYNASFTAETTLPDITNLVGYESHYNPLNITIGNPNLQPQHTYKTATYFVKNSPQHEQMLYTYFDASVTIHQLMPSISYDRQTAVYSRRDENVNGNWSSLAGITFNRAFGKSHRWRMENALWLSYSNMVWRGQDFSATDASMQRIKTRHIKIDDKLKLSFRASSRFDISLHTGIVHGRSWSNLSSYQNMRITDISYGFATRWSLPFGFQFSSNLSILHCSGYESNAMNRRSSIWNAQLSKSICHDRLTFSIMAHDILNRTLRNTWSISSSGYSNTNHNSLPRYAMLSVSYRFSSNPSKEK